MKNASVLLLALRTINVNEKMSVILKGEAGERHDDVTKKVSELRKSGKFVSDFTAHIWEQLGGKAEGKKLFFGTSSELDGSSRELAPGCKRDFEAMRKTGKNIYIILK